MSQIAQSLANLVKTNNGLFKSAAQAAFITSQGSEFTASGAVGRNVYTMFYVVDSKGVVKVQKQTVAKGLVLVWERVEAGQVSIQDAREIKRIKRLIKQTEQSMASREASRAAGEYPSDALYAEAQGRDQQSLETLQQMLAKLV